MKKIIVIVIIFIMGFASVAQAQDDSADCSVQNSNSVMVLLGSGTLQACSEALQDLAEDTDDGYVVGMWDDYLIIVHEDGDVFYQSHRSGEWVFAGNTSGESESTAETDSEPVAESSNLNNNWDIHDLVTVAANDIDEFWADIFEQSNLIYDTPRILLDDYRTVNTRCGRGTANQGPFYCSADHTIYLPYNFMYSAQEEIGDFAVVVILAHEWGHAIQGQLGILNNVQFLGEDDDSPNRRNIEIEADCLAGAYTDYAENHSENVSLDPDDLEEGAVQMYVVGSNVPEMEVWTNPRAHGRPEQRVEAYANGYENGVLECLAQAAS